ncbi:hypothetical protein Y1Q_0014468 [Alligator mississippiensis]|uniref:Uncharacterized protein n=1 Tax=Alligator mississippiensis TaxID=8496 RepID=A0A151PCS8_ALLMI|nr:hypothetical protein Y1Q_0014468 [Alligator mississippiensis]
MSHLHKIPLDEEEPMVLQNTRGGNTNWQITGYLIVPNKKKQNSNTLRPGEFHPCSSLLFELSLYTCKTTFAQQNCLSQQKQSIDPLSRATENLTKKEEKFNTLLAIRHLGDILEISSIVPVSQKQLMCS